MNVGNGSNPHDTAVKWAWQGIGKQFHYWVLFLLFSLSCLLAGRTLAVEIEYSGALLNLTDLSGSFPIGSPFTLSMDVDEMVADTSEEADRGFYPGCIRAVELSLADSGFSLAGSPGEQNEWEIRPGASLGEPASRAFCPITDGDGRMLEIEVRAYPKAGQPLGTKALTGGFEEGNFRLVEVIVYEVKTDPVLRATYRVTYGFGWVMANAPGRSATGPEPLASDGVGFEFMAVLGDSLSASRQERNSTTRSPDYFNGGYTNGPVWVQFLSWALGIPYRESLNSSLFLEYSLPVDEAMETVSGLNGLAVFWDNGSFYAPIILLAFGLDDPDLFESIHAVVQLKALRALEWAHASGIADILILKGADISFAPGIVDLLSEENRSKLNETTSTSNELLEQYLQEYVPVLLPGMRMTVLDPNEYLQPILNDPSAFGFSTVSDVYLMDHERPYDQAFGVPGTDYFFWDSLAPSSKVHSHLAHFVMGDAFPDHPYHQQGLRISVPMIMDEPDAGTTLWLYGANAPIDSPLRLLRTPSIGSQPADAEQENLSTFNNTSPMIFLQAPVPEEYSSAFFHISD